MARKRGRPPAPTPRSLLIEVLEYELGVAIEEIEDGLTLPPYLDTEAREGLALSIEDHFDLPENNGVLEVLGHTDLTFLELLRWVEKHSNVNS